MRLLITGACGVTSRAVARSLRLSQRLTNLYLSGTDLCENSYGLYEGLIDKTYRSPHVTETTYRNWMEILCVTERIDAAIVIPELEVLFWSARGFPAPCVLPPAQFCQIAVSKKRLYETLAQTGLVPNFSICSRSQLLDSATVPIGPPCWIRDFSAGASSGKGSMYALTHDQIHAWVILNPTINEFMLSEFLPGRNFACHLLYDKGQILKVASYERLEYFMARTAASGVTGNISRGRLINDDRLVDTAQAAVAAITDETHETMHGLIAVDFRESSEGRPLITEINLRHVAATYAFASAGFNLSEAQVLHTLGRIDQLGAKEATFSSRNIILRDIDGLPIWLVD